MEQRHVTLKLIRKLRLLFRQCSEVRTESLLHLLSLDLGKTGKSQSSALHGPAEVMFFSMAWTSEKPVLSCGLRGFKLCIHGGKEITWS